MHNFLARFSVKVKIIGGFSLILMTWAAVAIFVFNASAGLEKGINKVVDETIPIQRKAMVLKNMIDKSGRNLGFYLLGKDEALWLEFEKNLKDATILVDDITQDLRSSNSNAQVTENIQLMTDISLLLESYKEKKKILKKVAVDYSFNMQGLKMTLENLGPLNILMVNEIAKMRYSEEEEDYEEGRKIVLAAINRLDILSLRLTNEIRLYLAFRFPNNLVNIKERKLQINKQLTEFGQLLKKGELTLEQEESLTLIQQNYTRIFSVLSDIIRVHSGEKWRKDTYLIRKVVTPLINQINKKIDTFVELKTVQLTDETNNIVDDVSNGSNIVLLVSIMGIIIGTIVAWLITFHIIKRMNTAVNALSDIAEGVGNLKTRLDEVGNDEMSDLSASFNKFVTKIGYIVDLVIQSSSSLADEAGRMLDVTIETQSGVVNQQKEITSISIAIKEMTNTVEHIASHSSQAALTATEATTEAQHGQKVVKKSVETIRQLANEVENAVEVIKRVDKESEGISIVVSVISDISEQTNLLALNAAIEAARAGEHGRGFAVVADEVRNLSNKIQGQTKLIIDRIEHLQAGARDAVKVMTHGFETAKNSVLLSNEAGDALQIITKSVINISSVSSEIAKSTDIQSKVANDILKNISVISRIAKQTSQGALATKQSATEFRSMSTQLQGLVEQFLLDESSGVLDATHTGKIQVGENQQEDDIFF